MKVSIVVPTLNEAVGIVATLTPLAPLRARGVEVIVADGGSVDGTARLARPWADAVIPAPPGRAQQMNAGARMARGDLLLFLHADTLLPRRPLKAIAAALAAGHVWGRFDVEIVGRGRMLPIVARSMNLRSRWTGIATGDQALFVTREAFRSVGGFPDQPLMEDVEISRRLKRLGRPACLRQQVRTSGRRWEQNGVWSTIALMWRLRWLYWRGVEPADLARRYG